MSNDEETIDLAIRSLQKGIEKFLQRAAAKKPHLDAERAKKRAHRLVRHTRHLLIQLLEKRQSLQALIEWLSKEWKTRLQAKLADPEHTQTILAHALQCLVRCQDGLMLLTSGECRHPEDVKEANKTHFPSRLLSMDERSDGYTKLYSGAAYSGFGWDEYANETVGIQARLIQVLRPFHRDPWGYLEAPSQLLETLLDRQEDAVKNLKQSLQAIKVQMANDITKQLAKPKVFTTQDKMERIQVLVPARGSNKEQTITVVRMADNFKILGTSVLPNDVKTPGRWNRILALSLSSGRDTSTATLKASSAAAATSRKRRLTILEDSDSSDEENTTTRNKKTATAIQKAHTVPPRSTEASHSTGLQVRVETSKKATETEDSLKAIKTQMGADVRGLENSLQELEHESKATDSTHNHPSSHEHENVQRATKILHRAERRQDIDRDENEIWDARDCLRQAWVELGNDALWSFRSTKNLEQALSSFQQAKKLVVQQQEAHRISVASTNDQTTEARRITRDLLLLLAETTTNAGITLVQFAEIQQVAKKKHLAGSIREFRCARELISKMREDATFDLSKCPAHSQHWVNLKAVILDADKLESLACRWLGTSLWMTGSNNAFSSAEKVLQEGWSLFGGFNVACRNQLLPHLLEVASEAILAASTTADLGSSKLESLDRRTFPKESGEMYLSTVRRALRKQVEILRGVDDLKLVGDTDTVDTVESFQVENGFPLWQSIQQDIENIEKWWADDSIQSAQHSGNNSSAQPLSRADIGSNGMPSSGLATFGGGGAAARSRFAVSGQRSFQQKLPRNQTGRSTKALSSGTRSDSGTTSFYNQGGALDAAFHDSLDNQHGDIYQRPARFRNWGDEIIIGGRRKIQTSSSEPSENRDDLSKQFPYPTAAPPIPPEFRRLRATQGMNHQHHRQAVYQ
jgi:hypothetical protein